MRHTIRDMNKTLIHKINQRIAELGKSVQGVSVEATGAKETLRKILDGTTKSPRIDTIQKIAIALKTTPEWLMGNSEIAGDEPGTDIRKSEVRAADVMLPSRQSMANDVPVLGTAAGSHLRGAFQLTSDPVDWVRRPPALLGARDIYALYVEGDSMDPQYPAGTLIFVNPHKPPGFGDPVVIQSRNHQEGEIEATLGILSARSEKVITIKKRNPDAVVEVSRQYVLHIHKVLTTNELFGV